MNLVREALEQVRLHPAVMALFVVSGLFLGGATYLLYGPLVGAVGLLLPIAAGIERLLIRKQD